MHCSSLLLTGAPTRHLIGVQEAVELMHYCTSDIVVFGLAPSTDPTDVENTEGIATGAAVASSMHSTQQDAQQGVHSEGSSSRQRGGEAGQADWLSGDAVLAELPAQVCVLFVRVCVCTFVFCVCKFV